MTYYTKKIKYDYVDQAVNIHIIWVNDDSRETVYHDKILLPKYRKYVFSKHGNQTWLLNKSAKIADTLLKNFEKHEWRDNLL